jgi:cell division septation protein DedD
MMTSILNLETRDRAEVEPREAVEQDPALQALSATTEYEIVLGRAQIASWLFVGVIAVAICSSLAYLGGERIAADNAAALSMPAAPPAPPAPALPTVSEAAELPDASIVATPKTDLKPAEPLFAEPETGKVYIQIGAVERGMAMLLTEGLRGHGFDAFLAPGPNDKLFRVLIGPLPDPTAFRQAMVTVNALDLASFARKYQK